MNNSLLELISVSQTFIKPDGHKQKILDKINLQLYEGEIIAILGKSGSGKSSLLRIIANLVPPTKGKVKFQCSKNSNSVDISMIFQTFALFPWLTILENVELGLEATKMPSSERREKALAIIDLIGLDGFESAYPRELSGGMKQRVGFARALVVDPKIILMDEPFSALDIFTATTLKNDFLDLWTSRKTSLKSVVLVTHSIEEAVQMADRVLILASNPGHIVSEFLIDLPRPRELHSDQFSKAVNHIYGLMAAASQKNLIEAEQKSSEDNIARKLPFISPNQLAGVADTIISPPYKGSAKLAELVKNLNINTSEMLHITEALEMLKLALVENGSIKLNKAGKMFANGDLAQRKRIFAEHLLVNVPLAAYIRKILHERPDNKAPRTRFQTHLEDHLSSEDAAIALKTVIVWGRYGEIFSYDDGKKMFSLENPTA